MLVRISIPSIALLIATGGFGAAACNRLDAAERVTLLDGTSVAGTIAAIDGTGTIKGEGIPAGLHLADAQLIVREEVQPIQGGPTTARLVLSGGGNWPVKTVSLSNDKFQVESTVSEHGLTLPVEAVRGVLFAAGEVPAEVAKAIATPDPQRDRLFVKADDQLQSLTGLVERLTPTEIEFSWEKQKHTLPREKLVALVLAGSGRLSPAKYLVTTSDPDCSLPASDLSLDGEKCVLTMAGGVKMELPWSLIARVSVKSDRVAFVTDLEPVDARQESIVAPPRSWRRDKSVGGQPLKIGTQTFERGLGTQSRCELTYATDEKFSLFVATVGIDAETNGRGDCVCVVLGDGVELVRQRVRGMDPTKELKVDISGRRRVTLLVEPGEDLDLADHLDWANARFLKQAK